MEFAAVEFGAVEFGAVEFAAVAVAAVAVGVRQSDQYAMGRFSDRSAATRGVASGHRRADDSA